jgi:hypothetical protein
MYYYLRIRVKIKDHPTDQDSIDLIKSVPFLLHTGDLFVLKLRKKQDIPLKVNCIYFDNSHEVFIYFEQKVELTQKDIEHLEACGWCVPIEN